MTPQPPERTPAVLCFGAGDGALVKIIRPDGMGTLLVGPMEYALDSGVDGELRYFAHGTTRLSTGTTPTDRLYTGQRQQSDIGLYYQSVRWYDPYQATKGPA